MVQSDDLLSGFFLIVFKNIINQLFEKILKKKISRIIILTNWIFISFIFQRKLNQLNFV
jgi:hypothetical protein